MSQPLKQPKRGRPPLEPRIAKLEQFVQEFYATKYVEWQQRIAALEQRMDRFALTATPQYQSLFDKWPSNGSQKQNLDP